MPEAYDLIVIGGGHNGLVCAAYLARAGLSVCVLERRPVVGGGVITEEVTLPGFKHNTCSNFHGWIHYGPVYKDLELKRLGAAYIFPDKPFGAAFPDGRGLIFYSNLGRIEEEIGRFSRRDAEAFHQLHEEFTRFKDYVRSFLFLPPTPPAAVPALLQGTHDGRELLRFMMSNARNIVLERFEDERVRACLLMQITQAGISTDMYGSGMFVPAQVVLEGGWGLAVGGSGNLALAMRRAVEERGGVVRTGCHVAKLGLNGGRVEAAYLEDGTRLEVRRAVASNLEPKQTFLRLVGVEHLPAEVVRQVERWRPAEAALFTVHLALNQAPRWRAAASQPDLNQCWGVCAGLSSSADLDSQFADIRQGLPPRRIGFLAVTPTLYDPSQAPPGKHTMLLWQFAPSRLASGGVDAWDQAKEGYADEILEVLRDYAPNMTPDAILARHVISPRDLERKNISMIGGDFSAGELSQDQMGIFRPIHGYGPNRTPIPNLFLCGPSTHPGGSVGGACGYNAANVIAEELGLKKWWERRG